MGLPSGRAARSCSPRKCRVFAKKFPFQHSEFVNRALLLPNTIQESCHISRNPKILQNTDFASAFRPKILANWWDLPPTVGQIFDREEFWNGPSNSSGKA